MIVNTNMSKASEAFRRAQFVELQHDPPVYSGGDSSPRSEEITTKKQSSLPFVYIIFGVLFIISGITVTIVLGAGPSIFVIVMGVLFVIGGLGMWLL